MARCLPVFLSVLLRKARSPKSCSTSRSGFEFRTARSTSRQRTAIKGSPGVTAVPVPGSLALLLRWLLEDINAPAADSTNGAPDGLEEFTEVDHPYGSVFTREQLEAARDGRPTRGVNVVEDAVRDDLPPDHVRLPNRDSARDLGTALEISRGNRPGRDEPAPRGDHLQGAPGGKHNVRTTDSVSSNCRVAL
jgi:hypothetical protein